ncbi:MAG: LysM peptidoglycan-binding domain-containing protein [Bacteroidota bacterium]
MKTTFFIMLAFNSALCFAANSDSTENEYGLIKHQVVGNNYEYIPGELDYDLVADRLTCIQREIPLNYNTRVYAFINYFAIKDRKYTKMMLKRKNIYFPLFEKYLKKYNLPDELKYLSIIESGLNPKAVSSARAVGLWQFMSYTGRQYGLHQDWYLDERMDPEKSTEAACKLLKQLYGMFGDWELAIAAYNTGPGNVRKAIRRSGYKKTFWEIYPRLYRETRSYLPQFVAITYVMNYAEEHNFFEDELEYAVASDTLLLGRYVHFETLANQLAICEEDIKNLNPQLKRGVLPDSKKKHSLRIPADIKPTLNMRRSAILDSAGKVGKERAEYLARNTVGSTYGRHKTVYRVRSGDVLGKIAQRYGVRVSDLKKWNNLRGNTIRIGQRLNVWQKEGYQPPVFNQERSEQVIVLNGQQTYTVQPGDTLWDISRMFEGLSIEKIKRLNKLNNNKIKPGQKLIIGS